MRSLRRRRPLLLVPHPRAGRPATIGPRCGLGILIVRGDASGIDESFTAAGQESDFAVF
jgi:hypothetical protein